MQDLDLNAVLKSSVSSSSTDLARASLARGAAATGDADRAAKMFEELLSTVMVREMRRGLDEGFFGSGPGSDIFEGWLDEHVGKSLAERHTLDLAQAIRLSLGAKERQASDSGETP